MDKKITISYSLDDKKNFNCQVDTTAPFSYEELLYGISNMIQLFSQNTGVHPIQVASSLQNFIVEEAFKKINNMPEDDKTEDIQTSAN